KNSLKNISKYKQYSTWIKKQGKIAINNQQLSDKAFDAKNNKITIDIFMNSQSNQIKEVKKSIDICYHCRENEQIILLYTHTFYKKLNNPTMVTEALKFC